MSKFFAIITAAGFLLSAPALAGAGSSFDSADADSDGKLSMTEAMDANPDLSAVEFSRADADGDGMLSAEEYKTLSE